MSAARITSLGSEEQQQTRAFQKTSAALCAADWLIADDIARPLDHVELMLQCSGKAVAALCAQHDRAASTMKTSLDNHSCAG